MVLLCNQFNVELPLAYSVAIHESQGKTGPLGKSGFYQGPMGLPRSYIKERGWQIDDPRENLFYGIRALAIQLQNSGGSVEGALRRYNPKCNENNYLSDVMKYYRQLKRTGEYPVVQDHLLQRTGEKTILRARPTQGNGGRTLWAVVP